MGRIYYVGCRDCKVVRDLDKFYSMNEVSNRQEALNMAKEIEETDSFRAALLVSFMWEHKGHNCTAFYEYDEEIQDEFRVNDRMQWEKVDYWAESGAVPAPTQNCVDTFIE